ncbi:apoptosis-enhancing nuclease-like [Diadema antillarum]|uniref:apoptosis-enhancing nuclease-like n=1 Tax=Diadema antillarum TaxID=105358 RepID=UPI003A83983B
MPRRILRLLESSKRLHFQSVSLSKKRQMCITQVMPTIRHPVRNRELPANTIVPQCDIAQEQTTQITAPKDDEVSEHPDVNSAIHRVFFEGSTSAKADEDGSRQADVREDVSGPSQVESSAKRQIVAIDCEMVGVGPKGRVSALARCSVVDYHGKTIYDQYVKPDMPVTDYRTRWSGIRPSNMREALSFVESRDQVKNILKNKIIVGHAIINDLRVLNLHHPTEDIRDTSRCCALVDLLEKMGVSTQSTGLKALAKHLLHMEIQKGEHSSVEDAKATMKLYRLVERTWEEERASNFPDQAFRTSFLDDHFWPDDLF